MGGVIEIVSGSGGESLVKMQVVWLTAQGPHPSEEARTLIDRTFRMLVSG